MDIRGLPNDAVASFDEGLARHDAKHPRFLNMRARSVPGRNAARNQLLPRTRSLILKKAGAAGEYSAKTGRLRRAATVRAQDAIPTRKVSRGSPDPWS
jgi:hypothetical protein